MPALLHATPLGVRKKPDEEFPDLYDKDVPEPGPPDIVEPDEPAPDDDQDEGSGAIDMRAGGNHANH